MWVVAEVVVEGLVKGRIPVEDGGMWSVVDGEVGFSDLISWSMIR